MQNLLLNLIFQTRLFLVNGKEAVRLTPSFYIGWWTLPILALGQFLRVHNVYFWVRNTSTRSKFQKNASKWHFLSKNRFSKLVHKRKLNGTLVWALSSIDMLPTTNLHKTWSKYLVSRIILAYSTSLYLKNWLRYGENKTKFVQKKRISKLVHIRELRWQTYQGS